MNSKWCLQCGEENKPALATGVDEDGEPACPIHEVKRAVRQQETATASFRQQPKSAAVQPEKRAAVSDEISDKLCPGVLGKPCPHAKMIGARKEVCGACYARRLYHANNGAKRKKAEREKKTPPIKVSIPKKTTVATANSIASDLSLMELRAKLVRDLEAVDAVLALLNHS